MNNHSNIWDVYALGYGVRCDEYARFVVSESSHHVQSLIT